jgi:hypothetical protein
VGSWHDDDDWYVPFADEASTKGAGDMVAGLGGPSDDNQVGVLTLGDLKELVGGIALSVDERHGEVNVCCASLDSAPQLFGLVGGPLVADGMVGGHPREGSASGRRGGVNHGSGTDEDRHEAAEASDSSASPPEGIPRGV